MRRTRSALAGAAGGPAFSCPICGFNGPFIPGGGRMRRPLARCPGCGALERHRLVRAACDGRLPPPGTTLHVAPEPQLRDYFAGASAAYVTADIAARCDVCVDLTALGLRSASCDLVVAIHVLEHITDDRGALAELARLLRPGGLAVIAVPVVADRTVEYSAPNPREHLHVRAPGVDWYDRLGEHFSSVDVVSSDDVGEEHQAWIHEDRTRFPNRAAPERPPQTGARHRDHVAFATR